MRFHCNAATNRRQRLELAASTGTCRSPALALSCSASTVHRWKHRSDPADRSSRPRSVRRPREQGWQEPALELRRSGLTLDQCLDALKEPFPRLCRSTLHRYLAQNGLGRLGGAEPSPSKGFKAYEPGFVHVDLTNLPSLGGQKRYLFVAVDRATRLTLCRTSADKTKESAAAFLKEALAFLPFPVSKLLTDDGGEFTNRFYKGGKAKASHPFDELCRLHGIEHRLTKRYTPKTKGMVERMNGLIEKGAVHAAHYESHQAMEKAIYAWIEAYNLVRPHAGIERRTPLQEAIRWYKDKPDLFTKEPEAIREAFSTY